MSIAWRNEILLLKYWNLKPLTFHFGPGSVWICWVSFHFVFFFPALLKIASAKFTELQWGKLLFSPLRETYPAQSFFLNVVTHCFALPPYSIEKSYKLRVKATGKENSRGYWVYAGIDMINYAHTVASRSLCCCTQSNWHARIDVKDTVVAGGKHFIKTKLFADCSVFVARLT